MSGFGPWFVIMELASPVSTITVQGRTVLTPLPHDSQA